MGFVKIALYALRDEWTHASRQLEDGRWTSKLGPEFDITHQKPEDLEGSSYGKVVFYMKRSAK